MQAPPPESAARRYRIEKYLTEGGMGAIYIGKKLGPGGFAKEVVLKQLLPEYTSRPEFRDLFFREAKISATLDHANIVHTFDLVESDQSLFIVMEYVRGADLRTIIRLARQRKRELSPAAAIHVALEILSGLGYAHARRDARGRSLDIIHRDVSPSNIICSIQGNAKLSDFGIAKASTYSSVFYRVRGKVGYMSPEQARNQQIDHRCDLFSLSVCLYESLSGERLFVGDLNTPADEIYGIKPLPVSRKRAGLPPALDEVLARALAPHVDDRYQSAAELADALRTVAYKAGLAFSAPELASHLQDILGSDPERWLREEPAAAVTHPAPIPAGGSALVGKEAASIGIVNDIPEDEPGQSVLSPRAVSGSKDFDLDSMLNDEATRPGGEERKAPIRPDSPHGQGPGDDARPRSVGTPPPVWTRDSGPFALATPRPTDIVPDGAAPAARTAAVATAPSSIASSAAAASVASTAAPAPRSGTALPGVPPAPPAPRVGRPLPRATLRGTTIPPPFQAGGRGGPPPPPPARPPAGSPRSRGAGAGTASDDIEDTTPVPMGARVPAAVQASAAAPERHGGFEIEDVLTPPPPAQAGPAPLAGPAVPSRSLPASYPMPAPQAMAVSEAPAQPVGLQAPQTMDFGDAVTALLPEKKVGPPSWLAAMLILVGLVGGAALAHRLTRSQVAEALAVEPRNVQRQPAGGPDTPPTEGAAPGAGVAPASATGAASDKSTDSKDTGRPAARPADTDNVLDAPTEAKTEAVQVKAKGAAVSAHPSRVNKAAAKRRHTKSASKQRRGKH